MNRALVLAAAAIAAVAGLASPPLRAESFNAGVHARAFEAAERGSDSLRAFVGRTRMIYGLNYADYARAIPAADAEIVAGNGEEFVGFDLQPVPEGRAAPLARSPEQQAVDELREQILRDMQFE